MPWTISNILTVIRVALIPIVVAIYLVGGSGYLTAGLFLLALTSITAGYSSFLMEMEMILFFPQTMAVFTEGMRQKAKEDGSGKISRVSV